MAAAVNNYFLLTPKKPIRYLAIGCAITTLVLVILSVSFIIKASLSPSKFLYKYGISCGITALVVPLPIAIFILLCQKKALKTRQAEFLEYQRNHPEDNFNLYMMKQRSLAELTYHLQENPEAFTADDMRPLAQLYHDHGEREEAFMVREVPGNHKTLFLTRCVEIMLQDIRAIGIKPPYHYFPNQTALVVTIIKHHDTGPLKMLTSSLQFPYSMAVFRSIYEIDALRVRLHENNEFALADIQCVVLKEFLKKSPQVNQIPKLWTVLFYMNCAGFICQQDIVVGRDPLFANQEELVLNIINFKDTDPLNILTQGSPAVFSERAIVALRNRLARNDDGFTLENVRNVQLKALLQPL